jgi:hypothetical protein
MCWNSCGALLLLRRDKHEISYYSLFIKHVTVRVIPARRFFLLRGCSPHPFSRKAMKQGM